MNSLISFSFIHNKILVIFSGYRSKESYLIIWWRLEKFYKGKELCPCPWRVSSCFLLELEHCHFAFEELSTTLRVNFVESMMKIFKMQWILYLRFLKKYQTPIVAPLDDLTSWHLISVEYMMGGAICTICPQLLNIQRTVTRDRNERNLLARRNKSWLSTHY